VIHAISGRDAKWARDRRVTAAFGNQAYTSPYTVFTDPTTGFNTQYNLELNSTWNIGNNWLGGTGCNTTYTSEPTKVNYYMYVEPCALNNGTQFNFTCDAIPTDPAVAPIIPQFAIYGSVPSSIVEVGESTLTSTSSYPSLVIYDGSGSVVATSNASSIAGDGVTVFVTASSSRRRLDCACADEAVPAKKLRTQSDNRCVSEKMTLLLIVVSGVKLSEIHYAIRDRTCQRYSLQKMRYECLS